MTKAKETNLTPQQLRLAYAHGYFPMPEPGTGDILWFHPDPRAILPLERLHVSRSLKRTLRNVPFRVTIDESFAEVMNGCAAREDTWIDQQMKQVYQQLYHEGDAHSVEVWLHGELVGGLYGVALKAAFFAESKFHTVTDASKVALYHLVQHMKHRGMNLLEIQFLTPHLARLGAMEVRRSVYMSMLAKALQRSVSFR